MSRLWLLMCVYILDIPSWHKYEIHQSVTILSPHQSDPLQSTQRPCDTNQENRTHPPKSITKRPSSSVVEFMPVLLEPETHPIPMLCHPSNGANQTHLKHSCEPA